MTSHNSCLIDDLDWAELDTGAMLTELEPEHLDQALTISQDVKRTSRQWSCYIQALALFGFQDWLQRREPELVVGSKACSTRQPAYANVIDAVCNLQVGEFRVCLLPILGLKEEAVSLPRAVVELSDFGAHFYVAISVDEDAEATAVRGFLRSDQILEVPLKLAADTWSYQLSITQFNQNADELLLNLRCLDQEAILLPQQSQVQTFDRQAFAVSSLSKLQQENLQNVLTWEEGAAFLLHPELLEWLYQQQIRPSSASDFALKMQEQLTLATQQAINAARWLQGELDAVAQQLGLWLSPPQAAAIRWATYEDNRDHTIDYFRRQGYPIPDGLTPVHYSLDGPDQPWCLCLLAWPHAAQDEASARQSSWSLLLLLTTRNGDRLPAGTCLRVSNQVDVQSSVCLEFESAVLSTTVEGFYDERFLATVLSATAEPLLLLPCRFARNAAQ